MLINVRSELPRGAAIVDFASSGDNAHQLVQRAVNELNKSSLNGRKLLVRVFRTKAEIDQHKATQPPRDPKPSSKPRAKKHHTNSTYDADGNNHSTFHTVSTTRNGRHQLSEVGEDVIKRAKKQHKGEGKTIQRYNPNAADWNGVQPREAATDEYSRKSANLSDHGQLAALQGNAETADASYEGTRADMIFIDNLPETVSWQDLKDLMLTFSTGILRCQIASDRVTGKPKGYATARFKTKEDAVSALRGIESMDEFHGQKITAKPYRLPKPKQNRSRMPRQPEQMQQQQQLQQDTQ